jgi:hypothetical protein
LMARLHIETKQLPSDLTDWVAIRSSLRTDSLGLSEH